MNTKIKLFLVDDNKKFIEALKYLIEKNKNFEIIGYANNGSELFENNLYKKADIILLDIEMPGLNGFDTAININWNNSRIKLIAITMYQEKVYLEKLVSCGFRGFVKKDEISEKLTDVIIKVYNNDFVFPQDIKI